MQNAVGFQTARPAHMVFGGSKKRQKVITTHLKFVTSERLTCTGCLKTSVSELEYLSFLFTVALEAPAPENSVEPPVSTVVCVLVWKRKASL